MQTTPKTSAEISEFDWNFDDLPNDELVACCYYAERLRLDLERFAEANKADEA